MNVKQIVIYYLTANGYDGLFHEYGECGCLLSNLCPCDNMDQDCEPGHLVQNSDDEDGWTLVGDAE